jgi:anaerobic selenocysteine-containing dehydrogenase
MLDHYPIKRSPGSCQEPDYQVRTVCQECSVGCGLLALVKGDRIVDVQGDEEHPISRGKLCARGTAFVQGLTLSERLVHPAGRKEPREPLQDLADWKSSIDLLAQQLRQLKEHHGPDALLIGCDREGGLDFYLGAMRFAQLWGTSQVFHPLGEPMDPWPAGLNSPAASCSDWVHSRCLFLVEADLAVSHPVAFGWVLEAQRRGAHVVAADARFTPTLAKANESLRIKPGQGNLLGLALMKLIFAEGGQDEAAMATGFTEVSHWQASFEGMSLEGLDTVLGVPLEKLRHLARLLIKSGPVTVITGRDLADLPHHHIWLTLATAMGWEGQMGGAWYPIEAGSPPLKIHTYTGEVSTRPEGGHREIPPKLAEVKSRADQPVKAIICSGNCLFDYLSPFGRLTDQVDLIAHFGAFPNHTWLRAHLTFPAALWPERDGLAFSNDRAIQWGAKIVEPPEDCRPGLDFWMELAGRFGWEGHFHWTTEEGRVDLPAFYTWLLAQSPLTAKLKVDQLQNLEPGSQIFWPVGKIIRPNARAPYQGKIAPHPAPAELAPSSEKPAAADYPLAFQEVRISCRSGDASRFWPWTRGLAREDAVQINPETAAILGIENGDEVLVDTPRGVQPGRACLSRMVPRWLIASPHGVNGVPVLVHKTEQSLDEARSLLKELTI